MGKYLSRLYSVLSIGELHHHIMSWLRRFLCVHLEEFFLVGFAYLYLHSWWLQILYGVESRPGSREIGK